MHIDYDGLRHDMLCQVEQDEREALEALMEAMQDGEVPTCEVRTHWEICPVCEGEGGHSRRLGVIDHDTWCDWEDDERARYLSGFYDAKCDRCGGSGKVREVDMEGLVPEAREWLEGYYRQAWESAQWSYAERRAGC